MEPDADVFLELLLTGKYMPAIGLALIAFVTFARASLAGWRPWFATKPGGYLIGFGSAAMLYVATSLTAGEWPTLGTLAAALGAGWAASGGFEMVRDLFQYWRRKRQEAGDFPKATAVSLVLIVALLAGGCPSAKPYLPPEVHPIVAGIHVERSPIEKLLMDWMLGSASWSKVKDDAITAGVNIGGCALAEYVQRYLAPGVGRKAPPPELAAAARDTLESYRDEYANHATFRTLEGDL